MGSFNYFKIAGWNILKRLWALRRAGKLIKKIKEHGMPEQSAIMWLCSGQRHHRNLNKKTPWKCFKKNGKLTFDLSKPNKKFWKLYKMWLKIHKKYHLKFVPIMMMREDYCEYPFWHNVNGVTGFYDVLAMPIILKYIEKAVKIYIEVFGKTPIVIPWNEPNHHGDGHKFHKIMYDHETVWEGVLKPLGCKLGDVWPDLTASEGAGGELIEFHDCPKPGSCDRGGHHGKLGQNRKILGIKHDFTTLADFMVEVSPGLTKLQNMVQSANHWRLYTEDGGGTVNDGRYLAGPFNIPCGDAEQQYEMMKVLIQTWKETGFLAKYGTFPHECLTVKRKSDGSIDLFIPDYRPRMVNWKRIRQGVLKACKEKLGE
jgi:hypothetical protein